MMPTFAEDPTKKQPTVRSPVKGSADTWRSRRRRVD